LFKKNSALNKSFKTVEGRKGSLRRKKKGREKLRRGGIIRKKEHSDKQQGGERF